MDSNLIEYRYRYNYYRCSECGKVCIVNKNELLQNSRICNRCGSANSIHFVDHSYRLSSSEIASYMVDCYKDSKFNRFIQTGTELALSYTIEDEEQKINLLEDMLDIIFSIGGVKL